MFLNNNCSYNHTMGYPMFFFFFSFLLVQLNLVLFMIFIMYRVLIL